MRPAGDSAMSAICGTVSGKRVDLAAPDWRDIDIGDLARGLSLVNRFAGQSRRPFSSAQHSLVVAELAHPRARLPALLHDAHEALTGEWTTPAIEAVRLLGGEGAALGLRKLRRGLDIAIARRVLEDHEAVCEHGLAVEAVALADEMAGEWVTAADAEALQVEMAVREWDALSHGRSPLTSRGCELYGVVAPDPGVVMAEWVKAVRLAAFERYGGGP